MAHRVCFITIGQSPRRELITDLMRQARLTLDYEERGALDGLSQREIDAHRPRSAEKALLTLIADGTQVTVSANVIESRLIDVIARADQHGYDFLVLLSSDIFRTFATKTPLLHGKLAVDEWIASVALGTAQLGVVFPHRGQASDPGSISSFGTLIQNSRSVAFAGEANRIDETALLLQTADLILMHSVGYTDETAQQLAHLVGKPVVTARRIIAAALHLRFSEIASEWAANTARSNEINLVRLLPPPNEPLTTREEEVLTLVLEGRSNKEIARRLSISHRTVEIHRSRAMFKYNATTAMQLMRRVIIENPN